MRGLRWVTSTRGNGGSGNACVEHAVGQRAAYVRDSQDPHGPVLTVPQSQWTAFTSSVKADHVDA